MPLETIDGMVTQAMEWCDASEEPLLVPLNTWLWHPVPDVVSDLPCPLGIMCFVVTHDNQAVIYADREKAIHMHCLPSRKHIRSFSGNSFGATVLYQP